MNDTPHNHSGESKAELLPCPFCGDKAWPVRDKKGKYSVSCEGCMCIVGEGYDRNGEADHVFGTEQQAIAAWNSRADLARTDEQRVKALEIELGNAICLNCTLRIGFNHKSNCPHCRFARKLLEEQK